MALNQSTWYRYRPNLRTVRLLKQNQSAMIWYLIYGGIFILIVFPAATIAMIRQPEFIFVLDLLTVLFMSVVLAFAAVTWVIQGIAHHLLKPAHFERTTRDLVIHLTPRYRITLPFERLRVDGIYEHDVPKAVVLGFSMGHLFTYYYVVSPDLPWYCRWVGKFYYRGFHGPGFVVTSRHENHEELLDFLEENHEFNISEDENSSDVL